MLGLLRVVVRVALVAAAVLGVLHIVVAAPLYLQLRDLHHQLRIVCLLIVCVHGELSVNHLVAINSKRLWDEQSCLVPMSCRVVWACVQHHSIVLTCEICVEVERITMQYRCL